MTDVHVTVVAGGSTVVDQDFTSAANAMTFFTDNPLDAGPLAELSGGGIFGVSVMLSVASTAGTDAPAAHVLPSQWHMFEPVFRAMALFG